MILFLKGELSVYFGPDMDAKDAFNNHPPPPVTSQARDIIICGQIN